MLRTLYDTKDSELDGMGRLMSGSPSITFNRKVVKRATPSHCRIRAVDGVLNGSVYTAEFNKKDIEDDVCNISNVFLGYNSSPYNHIKRISLWYQNDEIDQHRGHEFDPYDDIKINDISWGQIKTLGSVVDKIKLGDDEVERMRRCEIYSLSGPAFYGLMRTMLGDTEFASMKKRKIMPINFSQIQFYMHFFGTNIKVKLEIIFTDAYAKNIINSPVKLHAIVAITDCEMERKRFGGSPYIEYIPRFEEVILENGEQVEISGDVSSIIAYFVPYGFQLPERILETEIDYTATLAENGKITDRVDNYIANLSHYYNPDLLVFGIDFSLNKYTPDCQHSGFRVLNAAIFTPSHSVPGKTHLIILKQNATGQILVKDMPLLMVSYLDHRKTIKSIYDEYLKAEQKYKEMQQNNVGYQHSSIYHYNINQPDAIIQIDPNNIEPEVDGGDVSGSEQEEPDNEPITLIEYDADLVAYGGISPIERGEKYYGCNSCNVNYRYTEILRLMLGGELMLGKIDDMICFKCGSGMELFCNGEEEEEPNNNDESIDIVL